MMFMMVFGLVDIFQGTIGIGTTDPLGATKIGVQMNQTTLDDEGLLTNFVFLKMARGRIMIRNWESYMNKGETNFCVNINKLAQILKVTK